MKPFSCCERRSLGCNMRRGTRRSGQAGGSWAWIVIVTAFVLGSHLGAQPSGDEKNDLQGAAQSYKDGAFQLCTERVAALLKKDPKTELLPQAELLQAQALYQLGRSDAALATFTVPVEQMPPELRSDTLFWQAESLLDLARWGEAEQKYRSLLSLKNSPERTNDASLGLAWALFKEGKESDAKPMIVALSKSSGPAGRQAQLLLAKIQLADRQFSEAITSLETLLATRPEPGLAYRTEYWLGQAYAANGEYDQAAATYKKITGDLPSDAPDAVKVQAFPKALVAQAFLGLGRAEHQLHQDDISALAYAQAYPLISDPTAQMQAFGDYLEDARSTRQLPDAIARLQEFAKKSTDSAPAALLAIGSVLAEDGQDDKAIGILESLLIAYGQSPWIPSANYQLGLLYARSGKPNQAVKAFQTCLASNPDPDLLRLVRFQLGYVLLNQLKDGADAAAQFSQLEGGGDALAEDAAYNLLLADAARGQSDAFVTAETDFQKRFPKSSYLKKIALTEGLLLAQSGKPYDAIEVYQKAIAQGGGADQEELLKALSALQYQTGDLAGTVATCQMIVKQFPDDSLIAAQRGILVSYEMKKLTDDQAEQALTSLAQKFDKSPNAAEAFFRLGEFYFYRQDYVKAQDAFQQLTTAYPGSAYAANAYFFAGRAAVAHNDYNSALALLEKVPDESPFKADSLLWEGRVYQQELNFIQACTLADAVLATEKIGMRFVAANLLKGECLFEMGTKNSSNYPQALAAFDQILKGKEGTSAERNEAAVRSAKCLEKMGRGDEAMGLYLDVLYGRVGGNDVAASPSDFTWQIEAGSEAGRIREQQKDWRGAIEVYRRLEQIGGPHQQLYHDLVNKLRQDNYIYE